MSVVRVIIVDPEPLHGAETISDLIVYQVPENSRAHKLLLLLCEQAGLQHVTIEPKRKKKEVQP